ncbi:hypothetical protein BD289DRAFT_34958 [Coniella lustricola]|uniref:N-acetyltransferase domain-containing protein n=1 Tax=Coniella lustricola TaxID=2025994 RepID=A0A2T3A2D0_9PEZI|nr:hypothetical protein BD289DRAFT_34958 [Coniella lustricola]
MNDFDDQRRRSRLLKPQAATFVAQDQQHDELMPTLRLTAPALQWQLNGVFTLPEAWRRGIAAAVMAIAEASAITTAQSCSTSCLLTAVIYTESRAAKRWYEQMGFTAYKKARIGHGLRASFSCVCQHLRDRQPCNTSTPSSR